MSLFRSAGKSADKPDPDAAIEAGLQTVRVAEAVVTGLQEKIEALNASVASKETDLAALALAAVSDGGNAATAYERALDAVAADRKEAARLGAALVAARGNAAKAKTALHQASIARTLKVQRKLANARQKAAGDLGTALDAAVTAWTKLYAVCGRVTSSWPAGRPPGGAKLEYNELVDLVGMELLRLSKHVPLQRDNLPYFPGTPVHRLLIGGPSKPKPLVREIEEANTYLLGKLQQPEAVS